MCRGPPEPGWLFGLVSLPYSHANRDVRSRRLRYVPLTKMSMLPLAPVPAALSGMEKRVTSVFVGFFVVHSTYEPVADSVAARRPEASPARSPTVRLGPTSTAPPPERPSSA